MKKHVSDHCAYHCRQVLLLKFLTESNPKAAEFIKNQKLCTEITEEDKQNKDKILSVWLKEMCFIQNLMAIYPGHESMWVHRRNIFAYWVLILQYFTFSQDLDLSKNYDEDLWVSFQSEMEFVNEYIEDDVGGFREFHRTSACAYRAWLLFVVSPKKLHFI
jgi:hypothetical protein